MEMCTTLLLLFALPSAAVACIPMKHVDPGIPAGCPVFKVNRADCDTITGSIAGGCLAPTHTSMTLACPTGRIVVVGGNYPQMLTAFAYSPSARCDTTAKSWVFRDKTNMNDVTQAQVRHVQGFQNEEAVCSLSL